MKKTLLTAVLAVSLTSLFACQTAKMKPTNQAATTPAERTIAEVPGEALEAVFAKLATTANVTQETFDNEIVRLVNANQTPGAFSKIGTVSNIDELKAKIGDTPEAKQAFLKRLSRLQNFGMLKIQPSDIKTATLQEFENTQTTGVAVMPLGDIVRPATPVSVASFKDAVDADPKDISAIVAAEKDIESKGMPPLVLNGCTSLRNPASIKTLATVVSETDAAVVKGDLEEKMDKAFVDNLGKETNDSEGACDRAQELSDTSRCGVIKKLSAKVCAE